MYCQHCGTNNETPGARFCSQCGKALDALSPETAPAVVAPGGTLPKRPLGWVFWVGAVFVLFGFVIRLLPDFEGAKPNGNLLLGQVSWTGILFAYAWNRRGRSRWAGFGVGALIGVVGIVVVSFMLGMRHAV